MKRILPIAAMLALAACGTSSSSATSPMSPTTATLTSAAPPSGIVMGPGIGVADGGAFSLLAGATTTTAARAATQLSGTVSSGTLCVQVLDVGNATDPVS